MVDAAETRAEIDLRVGAALTRFQTMRFQDQFPDILGVDAPDGSKVISYGSCQFPTLGFVVDRMLEVKSFKPQPFWYIDMKLQVERSIVNFQWNGKRDYNALSCFLKYDTCVEAKTAIVTRVEPSRKTKSFVFFCIAR